MTYIKKEWLSHLRENRLLILGVIVLFFSLSDPVMMYFTPLILESQVGSGVDLSAMFEVSQMISIQNFMGDIYQIFGIVVIIFAGNIVINEYKKNTIVIPYTLGLKSDHLIIYKYIVYTLIVSSLVFISSLSVHYYSAFIFEDFTTPLKTTLISALGLIIFINYNIALAFLVSAFKQSKVLSNVIVLFNYLVLPSLINMFKAITISPYKVIESLNMVMTRNILFSCILTVIVSILFVLLAGKKLKSYPSY